MKYLTFRQEGEICVGRLGADGTTVEVLSRLPPATAMLGVAGLIGSEQEVEPAAQTLELASLTLLAPVPRPRRNIICVGKNYAAHAKEFSGSGFDSGAAQGVIPTDPIVFSKVPECVVADGDAVVIDASVSTAIDYEAELCVIIGREGRGISRAEALDFVWGYTIVNDITARDLQKTHSQWFIGKSQDTFCPMGPFAVTRDEVDLKNTAVKCWVNGELRQSANTADLVFDVPALIEAISAGITLYAGDMIATGTPAGVGIGYTPPKYLKAGDIVRVEIDGIGVLENTMVEA